MAEHTSEIVHYSELYNLIVTFNSRSSIRNFKNKLNIALEEGMDINFKWYPSQPLLWDAINLAKERLIPILLDKGADPNFIDHGGRNGLIFAIYHNLSEKTIQLILDKTNDINLMDNEGATAFSLACGQFRCWPEREDKDTYKNIAKRILLAGADPFLNKSWQEQWGWETGNKRMKEIEQLITQCQCNQEIYTRNRMTYEYEI